MFFAFIANKMLKKTPYSGRFAAITVVTMEKNYRKLPYRVFYMPVSNKTLIM